MKKINKPINNFFYQNIHNIIHDEIHFKDNIESLIRYKIFNGTRSEITRAIFTHQINQQLRLNLKNEFLNN